MTSVEVAPIARLKFPQPVLQAQFEPGFPLRLESLFRDRHVVVAGVQGRRRKESRFVSRERQVNVRLLPGDPNLRARNNRSTRIGHNAEIVPVSTCAIAVAHDIAKSANRRHEL